MHNESRQTFSFIFCSQFDKWFCIWFCIFFFPLTVVCLECFVLLFGGHVSRAALNLKNPIPKQKLRKANDEIRGGLGKQHEDLETWKTTCDRLTASVARKETELQNLSDKCRDLENQVIL